jgi:transglutaminase-like putative cysteine protease
MQRGPHNAKRQLDCAGGARCPTMLLMSRLIPHTAANKLVLATCCGLIGGLLAADSALARNPKTADGATRRGSPVLHEPLPALARSPRTDAVVRGQGGRVDAIETAGGRIEKPEVPGKKAPQAPLYEAPRHDKAKVSSDAKTTAEGTLHYRAVFNPTVAPFKRDLSFDRVNDAGQLEQSGAGLRAIRPRGKADHTGHELFWGHVTVELVPSKRTPIPSVAPTAVLVHADSTPRRALSFFRDAAGNFSVTSKRKGTVSLRYLMAARSIYFAAPIGGGAVVDDPTVPALGTTIFRRMQRLWPALGVAPNQTRKVNVEKLVDYFRGFTPGVLADNPGGDLLVDLIVARKGVCRHRSHAFVAVAHSLGIPAHYVINDAHAFVEVWLPGADGHGHWQRVDLGGGADTLRLHGADRKHLHDPLFRDPLPRPQAYDAGVTGVVADGRLNDSSWAGAGKVVGANALVGRGGGSSPARAQRAATQDGTQGTSTAKPGGGDGQRNGAGWLRKRAQERTTIAKNVAAPARVPTKTAPRPGSQRTLTRLRLTQAAPIAYIGETLRLRGNLTLAGGQPAAKMPIEVWLVAPRDPTKGKQLGSAVTAANGTFETSVAVPMSAQLGEHDVVVYFPGRGKLAPSYSQDQ